MHLLRKLKPGGLLFFDYIKSEAKGLDHPKALEMRPACLTSILKKTRIIYGTIRDINMSVGLCIVRKKAK